MKIKKEKDTQSACQKYTTQLAQVLENADRDGLPKAVLNLK